MEIKEGKERDTHLILKIERQCFTDPISEDDIKRELRRPKTKCLLAYEGGRCVAFVIFSVELLIIEIVSGGVLEKERMKGYGRGLMVAVKRLAERHGKRSVALMVNERAVGSQLFLQKMGFKCKDQIKDVGEDACDTYMFDWPVPNWKEKSPV